MNTKFQHEIVQAALRYWMKRNFAEYRTFKDHEIDFEFLEDGSVVAKCYKTDTIVT